MLYIYQIGNYRVNLVPSSKQGESHSTPTTFRRAADELTGISGDFVYTTPGRPLVKAGKWKVEGALVCGANATCASVDQQFNRLIANGADVVPIIAAIPPECCPCQRCNGTGCENCSNSQEFTWLLTYGTVTEYNSDYNREFNGSFGSGELNVSMTIEGPTHWEPLNDIEWKYWGTTKPTYPDMSSSAVKNGHPLYPVWHSRPDAGFQRIIGNGTFMYDPSNWIEAYRPVMNRRNRAQLVGYNSATPTITITEILPLTYTVDVPYYTWPAQPRSMYYFANLPQEGILSITVTGLTLHGVTVQNTATLDLAELNVNTELPGGISLIDVILAGDVNGNYNGLYLSGGGSPVGLYIPWERTGIYPGEVYVGRNTVEVSITDNPDAEIEFAYLHIYRRY